MWIIREEKLEFNCRRKTMDNRWNIGEGGDMPIGFGLSLAANEKSMEAFAKMSDAEKEEAVEKSRHMQTRADMEQFVNSLGESLR